MADVYLPVIGADGVTYYEKVSGAGTNVDPHVRYVYITGGTGVELGPGSLVDLGPATAANSISMTPPTDATMLGSDLQIGAKSLALTLSTGVGSVPIPDTAKYVGVKPVSSTSIRVGLEAPEADGTATGTAVAGDLKKGLPVDAAVWTWFSLGGTGSSRVLYVKGGSSDVLEVAVL